MTRLSTLLLISALPLAVNAFQVAQSQRYQTARCVIKSEGDDFDVDTKRGGVRLAEESAIKLKGEIKHKPGSATPKVKDLIRYTGVKSLDEKKVQAQLGDLGATIVCTGEGTENYKDPGETIEEKVYYAPLEAVRDALMGAGSAMEAEKLIINVAGGDDLQVTEVLKAVEKLVIDLDVKTKAQISFNSLSHDSFPKVGAAIAVVGMPEENAAGGKTGTERSVSQGEVYASGGKWFTVVDEDINSAVA